MGEGGPGAGAGSCAFRTARWPWTQGPGSQAGSARRAGDVEGQRQGPGGGHLRGGIRDRSACGRQAGGLAAADQPAGHHTGAGLRAHRLVPCALGNRAVLPRAQGGLPRREAPTWRQRSAADGAGPVHGHCLAHQPVDAAGACAGRLAGGPGVRDRRVEGGVHSEQEAHTQGGTRAQHGAAADRAARGVSGAQG